MELLRIDPTSSEAPYEQVRRQIAEAAAAGMLAPGHKLPTVRRLATELGLASNTVARAYRELEASGLVTTRRRVGTIVQAAPAPAGPELQEHAVAFVREARAAGLSDDAVIDLVRGALLG